MLTRREVFDKLNSTNNMPSPSGTTMKVIQLCSDETTSLNDIARVIETDPALSAELLKYANTAFLSTGIQVASVQKAAIKLGTRTVVNLALGLSLLASNKQGKCAAFDYEKFWSLSLLQAIAAKIFAGSGKEFDPEEMFICALLSHMGQLAFASLFAEEYAHLLNEFGLASPGEGAPSTLLRKTMEKERFEIDSSELTVELFLNWGLPAHYALAAGFHDDLAYAELGTGTTQTIAELLNLAHQLADISLHLQPTQGQFSALVQNAEKFNVSEEDFGGVFDKIISQWQEWGEVFKIQTRQCPLYNEMTSGAK
jgi:HD-like signal output (HDOD) protein